MGGYSQERISTRTAVRTLPAQLEREQRDGDGHGRGQLVGDPEEQVEQRADDEHERRGGELAAALRGEDAAEDAGHEQVAVAERRVRDAGELQLREAGGGGGGGQGARGAPGR